jgi:hypothetical protein
MLPTLKAPTPKADADPQTGASSRHGFRLPVIVVSTVLLATACRLVLAVWRYSVNLIFWDQWDFYTPLFNHASLWQIFTWQHGPHREGIGLVLDKFVLESTRWNSRAEALFMVAALVRGRASCVALKQKLFGSTFGSQRHRGLDYSDIAIPCLFLTFAQMEALVGEANPSYSAIPELLIGLYCLAWMLPKPIARYAAVLALNFLLIYTGFGFFMGVVTLGILLFDLRRACERIRIDRLSGGGSPARGSVLGQLLLSLSLGSGRPVLSFSRCPSSELSLVHRPHDVVLFGLRAVALASVAGGFLVLAAFAILIWHGVHLWRNREWSAADRTVVILLSFSLLFAANAAVGRVCLGMPEAAQISRYMGLLVPAFLAIYFHLLTWRKSTFRTILLALFVIVLIPAAVRMPNGYSPQVVSDGKQAWKTCILQTGNIDYCDHATGFPLHPNPRATQLLEKLQFLQKNRLNLYSEDR